jgi:hypothetical protein
MAVGFLCGCDVTLGTSLPYNPSDIYWKQIRVVGFTYKTDLKEKLVCKFASRIDVLYPLKYF